MTKQLDINFEAFPNNTFKKVAEGHNLVYIEKLLKIIDNKNHIIAGYRSQEEQRKKKKK